MGVKGFNLFNSFIIISVMSFLPWLVANLDIKEYPLADSYFDRIYVIRDGSSVEYLHAYCKESNVLSLSLTSAVDFEEEPRFPIYPPNHQAPKMQHNIYTFFQACNVKVEVNTKTMHDNLVNIIRKQDNMTIFSIQNIYKKSSDHIEIETKDVSHKWGMGERFQKKFAITDGIWTIWNRDRPFEIDNGKFGRSGQTYGHQPVYLARQNTGKYHMIYFKNTHAFNFESKDNSNYMKYISTGGNRHFVVFVGDKNPENILKKYHQYIGPAHIPPFWAMGWHQSRWGYKTLRDFEKIVDQYDDLQIPLDTMWSDLDYMKNKAIFTVDQVNYPPQQMRKLITSKEIHYIPLIDVGVSLEDKLAIGKGKEMNIFIKSKQKASHYEAVVWPGKVHFVDYLHPNSSIFWESQLDRLHKLIPFSGVWLDMNEPSNFHGNEPISQSYKVQFNEGKNMMTIDANLEHYCLGRQSLKHNEVHAYYGHLSTLPTHQFLKQYGRPFIVSRSNSVGSGAYAAHWTGDNTANWDFLRLSIGGNFLFQIFGIQMVGADICGFHQNTNEQLCSRWMQLGSFYPFSRNHNQNQSISQQPWVFGEKLLETSKISLKQRYSLLKQMYTTLVNKNGTGSFYRPIFFEFYDDSRAFYEDFVESQFLIGDYLMGAPIIHQDHESRKVYFPGEGEMWYELNYQHGNGFNSPAPLKRHPGKQQFQITNILPSPLPIFLRGGKLIMTTSAENRSSRLKNKFTIVAAMKNSIAQGQILAINSYSSDEAIDQCIKGGCNMQLKISEVADQEYMLAWSYTGNVEFRAVLEIERVRLADPGNDFVSKSSAILIDKPKGEHKIYMNRI